MIQKQKGFALVESLVAIALVGIAMVGATSLVITVTNANMASRGYASLTSDIYTIVDNYRNTSYNTLLNKFGSNPIAITNGQTVIENSVGNAAKATYITNLVAIKSTAGAVPEAIRVEITATQRRGIFDDSTFSFQTLIAPTS